MNEHTTGSSLKTAFASVQRASLVSLRRRDSRLVFLGVTAGYLLAYLYAIGHLAPGIGGFDLVVVADPLAQFVQPALGPFSFEPIARIRLGPLTYLFSLNTLLGLAIAGLVGLNFAVSYLAWRQPAACGMAEPSSTLLASVPALLSGTACCGPAIVLVLGIQASSTLLTAFQWLLPIAVLLLVASLMLVGRQIQPSAI